MKSSKSEDVERSGRTAFCSEVLEPELEETLKKAGLADMDQGAKDEMKDGLLSGHALIPELERLAERVRRFDKSLSEALSCLR